jgi:hypothetical protein
MANTGWIGVDLDGTLAIYDGGKGAEHIGEPVPAMVDRVKRWLDEGKDVRVFTARVWEPSGLHPEFEKRHEEAERCRAAIQRWCRAHIGRELPVTCQKDFGMVTFYDDRCVRVEANTGRLIE